MNYFSEVTLRDGRTCVIRNGTEADAGRVLDNFILTHSQTDFLLSLPGEINLTVEKETEYLKSKSRSGDEVELVAEVDGVIVGTAGVDRVGRSAKIRHRAEMGISIELDYCGLGIGREMTRACIECARKAGYAQLELSVVSPNGRAVRLYESEGFSEYGRNPLGFLLPGGGYQEIILMRKELGTEKVSCNNKPLTKKRRKTMEEQTIKVTIRTKGEKCELTDAQIREWYEKNVAKLFNPEYGTPEISVSVERKDV